MIPKEFFFPVLIPAAGNGTRSKLTYPKTLFRINEKTILNSIISKIKLAFKESDLEPFFLISFKEFGEQFYKEVSSETDFFKLVYQEKALGSGNAVFGLLRLLNEQELQKFLPKTFLLVWGDCVGFKPEIITKVMSKFYQEKIDLLVPGFFSAEPYTSIFLSKDFRINEILEYDKNIKITPAYTDIGVFVGRSESLLGTLAKELYLSQLYKRETSFVRSINYVCKSKTILFLDCASSSDKVGFNSAKDIEQFL